MTDWIHTHFWGRWPSRVLIWATCPCRQPGAVASFTGWAVGDSRCDSCGRREK